VNFSRQTCAIKLQSGTRTALRSLRLKKKTPVEMSGVVEPVLTFDLTKLLLERYSVIWWTQQGVYEELPESCLETRITASQSDEEREVQLSWNRARILKRPRSKCKLKFVISIIMNIDDRIPFVNQRSLKS
jgi:hypothetical protein